MFTVDPNSLYSLDELRELLHGLVGFPTLMERLGLREGRVFRDAVWGFEIIRAAQKAKPFSEPATMPASVLGMARGIPAKRNRKSADAGPVRRLSAKDFN